MERESLRLASCGPVDRSRPCSPQADSAQLWRFGRSSEKRPAAPPIENLSAIREDLTFLGTPANTNGAPCVPSRGDMSSGWAPRCGGVLRDACATLSGLTGI